jgi:hypothetical protein
LCSGASSRDQGFQNLFAAKMNNQILPLSLDTEIGILFRAGIYQAINFAQHRIRFLKSFNLSAGE